MSDAETLLAGKNCLVLDDEFLIALDLKETLEQAGAAAVICVATADEALAAMGEEGIDFAVLDLYLGNDARSSLVVAAELTVRKTPYVFLTGMDRDAGLLAGYLHVPVIEKPYQTASLLAAIRKTLRAG